MRFCMVDRILHEAPGQIRTLKTISFEEFSLLKPWDRKGAFPESLMLQVAVESAALLLTAEEPTRTGILEWVEELRFLRETRPGSVLNCEVRVEGAGFRFSLEDQWGPLSSGLLGLRPLPQDECREPEAQALLRAAITPGARHGAP